MTTKEAASYLGVVPSRICQMIGDGLLPAKKHGRDWVIYKKDARILRRERRTGREEKTTLRGRLNRFLADG